MNRGCTFCYHERYGISEILNSIYFENNMGDMQKIEDTFYCKIHGIIIEDLGGNLKRITQESKSENQ